MSDDVPPAPVEAVHSSSRSVACACGATVSLWSARVVVGGDEVELCCPSCGAPAALLADSAHGGDPTPATDEAAEKRSGPEREPVESSGRLHSMRGLPPRRAAAVGLTLLAAGAAVVAALLVVPSTDKAVPEQPAPTPPVARKLVSLDTDAYLDLSLYDDEITVPEQIPGEDEHGREEAGRSSEPAPMPHAHNEAIQEVYEAHSGTWVHPVVESPERVPARSTRRFGAARPGDRPGECGAGHCGVDLEGPRGTPIVAVHDGLVARIVNDPHRPSGKYVKVLHDDGTAAFYMHLDDALGGLMPGDRVRAGDMIGELGTSGINSAIPHLHFAFRVRAETGGRYIDPAPLLATSRVVGLLEIGMPDLSRPPTTARLEALENRLSRRPAF